MFKVGKYNIRVVFTGDKYGRNDCLVNDNAPMVEFYDTRFDHPEWMGRGQLVSRYYLETIKCGDYSNGLSLDGGIPEWTVSADEMRCIQRFLFGVINEPKVTA